MKENLELTVIIPSTPKAIFEAWLDSESHSEMTGGEASCSTKEGDSYSAWDGYISGTNIKLTAFEEIVQTWRTTEFPESDEDSHLIIQLLEHVDGTELTLIQTNIPEGQTQYISGWKDHYFKPMNEYFSNKSA